jgi:hypothetical protein
VASGAKGEEGVAAGPGVGTDVGLWGGEGEAPGRKGMVGVGKHIAFPLENSKQVSRRVAKFPENETLNKFMFF